MLNGGDRRQRFQFTTNTVQSSNLQCIESREVAVGRIRSHLEHFCFSLHSGLIFVVSLAPKRNENPHTSNWALTADHTGQTIR